MEYNNNNNSALAEELEVIVSQLKNLDSENVSKSLNDAANLLTDLDRVARSMDVPNLRALAHWMILNTDLEDDSEENFRKILEQGSYYNWLISLVNLLREYDQSYLPEIYTNLTKPNWPIKPSIPLLKDFANWIEETKNSQPTTDSSENISVDLALNETTDAPLNEIIVEPIKTEESTSETLMSSIDIEQTTVFEEIDINILEKNYVKPNTEFSSTTEEQIDPESVSIVDEKVSFDLDDDVIETSSEDFISPEDCLDIPKGNSSDVIIHDDITSLIPVTNIDTLESTNIASVSDNENQSSSLFDEYFISEIEDILMNLGMLSSNSQTVNKNSEKIESELDRLQMISEIDAYPIIGTIGNWCKRNIKLLIQDHSDESLEFISSNQSWTWLEFLHGSINEPDELSHLSSLSAELMRKEWPEALDIDNLQELLLFLKDPKAIVVDHDDSSISKTENIHLSKKDNATKFTLSWDDDIHPELLEAYFEETPEHVTNLCSFLDQFTNKKTSEDERQVASRMAHTIKGGSAILGITALSELSHKLEIILDHSVKHPLSAKTMVILSDSSKCLNNVFKAVRDKHIAPKNFTEILTKLTVAADTVLEHKDDEPLHLSMPSLPDFITKQESQSDEDTKTNDKLVETVETNNDTLILSNESNDLHDFTSEVDDIVMTLSTLSSTSTVSPANIDQFIAELQRLDLLSEISGFSEISEISTWCQQNFESYSKSENTDFQQFVESGESWSWIELLSATLIDPEETGHLSALSSELMREEWPDVLAVETLQNLLLFLKSVAGNNDKENVDQTNDETSIATEPDFSSENDEKISLKNKTWWSKDTHPELLSVYLEETPDQIAELCSLLHTFSNKDNTNEEREIAARLAHTIKGASGVVGINELYDFSTKLEEILDYSVAHKLPKKATKLLITSSNVLKDTFKAIQSEQTEPVELKELLSQLGKYSETLEEDSTLEEIELSVDTSKIPDFITEHKNDDAKENREENVKEKQENILEVKQENKAQEDPNAVISWDEDVHPELLSVYLEETPEQISEVASLLHRIANGDTDTETIKNASRIVHTIKGASGVVGIDSIVGLTHLLEDILDYSIENSLPENVADLLVESSDCLEELFESINNKQVAPDEYGPVLAKLTNFSQTLSSKNYNDEAASVAIVKEDKKTTKEPNKVIESTLPLFTLIPENSSTKITTTTNLGTQLPASDTHIRIPIHVIDKLLNIAGELVTTSSQVSDKINNTLDTNKEIKIQDARVHKMLDELSTTILKQEKDQYNMISSLKNSEFDNLEMDTYNELHSISGLLTESILDSEAIESNLGAHLNDLSNHVRTLDQLNKELSEVILSSRMVSINTLVPRLERIVRQTCRKTGKQAELIITGNSINIDTDILNGLTDPLLHLLRNSIDHGIEASKGRKKKGKEKTGKINLSFSRQGKYIRMELTDDGAGIDANKVYKSAIEKGIISSDQELSQNEKIKLILHAGFSTRNDVTDISGRGVGMDVVNDAVKLLNGNLKITSELGEGTTITIDIPLTLVTSATLLVRISDHLVAIPSDSIEQLFYLSPEMIVEKENGRYIEYNEEELPIQSLATLLDWPEQGTDFTQSNTLLIIKGDSQTHAIYIDEIIYSREVVIKSLAYWLESSKGLVGACHLPDGGVAPVINLSQLLSLNEQTNNTIKQIQISSTMAEAAKEHTPQILIVDDSLSNRKALSLIIEQTEYDVITAVDGLDALHIMNENTIDMVFTDLEMPRMNGLELTQAIRAWDEKKQIPIVMITSRTTNKHRQLAEKAGVNGYLTKPVVTEILLESMEQWLNEEANTSPA